MFSNVAIICERVSKVKDSVNAWEEMTTEFQLWQGSRNSHPTDTFCL